MLPEGGQNDLFHLSSNFRENLRDVINDKVFPNLESF